jgi:DNA-binding response OmpR family regulator
MPVAWRLSRPTARTDGTAALSTILVVDDDPHILAALQFLLEQEGYRVLAAQNGEAALGVAATEQPELVVTDWKMPCVDGVELCRRLKQDRATAPIPVVMTAGTTPPEPADQLWNAFFLKPVPVGRLLKSIRTLLRRSARNASGRP